MATSQGIQTGVEPDYESGVDATLDWLDDWRLGLADQVVANINIPTCAPPSEIRGTVETVTATAFNGRPYGPADCTSTVTDVPEDIDAFNNGFIAIADVGLGS